MTTNCSCSEGHGSLGGHLSHRNEDVHSVSQPNLMSFFRCVRFSYIEDSCSECMKVG